MASSRKTDFAIVCRKGWSDVLARTARSWRPGWHISSTTRAVQEAEDGDGSIVIQLYHQDIQVRYMGKGGEFSASKCYSFSNGMCIFCSRRKVGGKELHPGSDFKEKRAKERSGTVTNACT